jgi:hypothetical protein
VVLENAIDGGVRDLDAVIAGEIPDDADRAEMVVLAQVQNLLDDLRRCPLGWVLGNGPAIDQDRFSPVR